MARPPLALGHHGTITTKREGGRWVSRCRVRDFDGVTRRVARWGGTKAAAQAALQDDLQRRHGDRPAALRPASRFRDAADVWLGKTRERREDSTVDTYQFWLERSSYPVSANCDSSSATSPSSTSGSATSPASGAV